MFKDLQKLVQQSQQQEQELNSNEEFERLRDKPFWIWDIEEYKQEDINTKGDCCFNHICGLPIKEKLEKLIKMEAKIAQKYADLQTLKKF